MLTTRSIESHLQHIPSELCDIVLELRNLVATVTPNATEALHRTGMTYFDVKRGGPVSAGICQIGIQRDHVRLAFIHGAFLPDPRGLLEGNQKYKRYVRITSYEDADWGYLKELIVSSSRFDPYTLQFK
jgi:hypothetical protein